MLYTTMSQKLRYALFSSLLFAPFVLIHASTPAADELSLQDRVFISSKIYSSVKLYFAHGSSLPNFDLDERYKAYLKSVIEAPSRREFDLATIAFIAELNNGHTSFNDEWLRKNSGGSLGILAHEINGAWVVQRTTVPGLAPGDIITAIDAEDIGSFLAARARYCRGRTESIRRARVFSQVYLWPRQFSLSLQSGRKLQVDRDKVSPWPERATQSMWIEEPRIAYIKIPSFGDSKFEDAALEAVRQFKQAKAIIVDVRGNDGGSTPSRLIEALMNRPFRSAREATPLRIGVLNAYGDLPRDLIANLDTYSRGAVDAYSSFGDAQLTWGGSISQPQNNIYTGGLFLLVDHDCVSACEDFIMPFKDNHRATVVGETTYGSTGQPYIYMFGNGMSISVGAKRTSFPDGTDFEGVGIKPDLEVQPRITDLKSGSDTVLEQAIRAAQ